MKSLLHGPALERRRERVHRFCPQKACKVVYFGQFESFLRNDVTVPVFLKEQPGNRIFCYCLEIREQEIPSGATGSPPSESIRRIRALVKSGRCACRWKAPQGVCCLGNLSLLKNQEERA